MAEESNDSSDSFKDLDDSEVEKLVEEEAESFTILLKRNEALTEQLLNANISNDDSTDEVKIKARAFALKHLPEALQTIAELASNADKDSTRLSAARTIWAIASATSTKDDTNPIEELFKRLETNNGNT